MQHNTHNYNSHHWREFLRVKGSVIPHAVAYALVPAAVAFILKLADIEGWTALKDWGLLTNNAAFGAYTWTLGFVLVFRTSQCYTRFWACATGICTMRSQMYEAASSLVNFVVMSKKPKEEKDMFKHKIVRLFSLMHAMSLVVISDLQDHRFPVIDMESIPERYLKVLDGGLLNVPPPILSRVFQELEKAMVEYNQVLQVMTIAFPFPYAQVSVVMIWFYMLIAPVVLVQWTEQPPMAALFAFISSACFLCLEMIAAELENPFGEDPNDLPCHMFQDDMNEGLILLIEPSATMGFELGPDVAIHAHLIDRSTWRSFEEGCIEHCISATEKEEWSDDETMLKEQNEKKTSERELSLKKVQDEASAKKKPVAEAPSPAVQVQSPRAAATKPPMLKQCSSQELQRREGDAQMQKQSSPLYLQRKEGDPADPPPPTVDVQGVHQDSGLSAKQIPIQMVVPEIKPVASGEGINVNTDLEKELVKVLQQIRHTIDTSGGWLQQIHDSLAKTPMVRIQKTQDSHSLFEVQT